MHELQEGLLQSPFISLPVGDDFQRLQKVFSQGEVMLIARALECRGYVVFQGGSFSGHVTLLLRKRRPSTVLSYRS